jgi:tetratricopeptide (TPR) repeat protein
VDALGVYPHAHYLATDMQVSAALPDGTTRWLIRIKAWDFHKQDQYRYASPVFLPRGTVLTMQYTYDNSDGNRHNLHTPPQRVTYGPRSSDEMGDLWIQVRPRRPEESAVLARDAAERDARANVAAAELMVQRAPGDAGYRNFLGASYLQVGRVSDGFAQLQEAIRLRPHYAEAHNNLGSALVSLGRIADAIGHFRQALAANPRFDRVHFNLANALNAENRHDAAAAEFRRALAINPDFAEAHNNLGVILGSQRRFDEAVLHFEQALAVHPAYAEAHNNLGLALGSLGRKTEAITHFQRALAIRPDYADARSNLSMVETGK